jgi:hypothetical protein
VVQEVLMLGRVALVKVRATAESVDPETGVRRFWRIESRRAHLEETMVGQMGGWPEMVLSLGVASFYQASGVTPDCTFAWAEDEATLAEHFPWHEEG